MVKFLYDFSSFLIVNSRKKLIYLFKKLNIFFLKTSEAGASHSLAEDALKNPAWVMKSS